MLKRTITYVDFDGNERTEDFFFHFSKTELTEMETSVNGGLSVYLRKIVKIEDTREIFAIFKKIILSSVGVKSDDGKRFIKSEEIAKDFESSPAFDELFMSFMGDSNVAAEFVNAIIPADLSDKFQEELKKNEKAQNQEVINAVPEARS